MPWRAVIALLWLPLPTCECLHMQQPEIQLQESYPDVDGFAPLYDVQEYQNLVSKGPERMSRVRVKGKAKTICKDGKSMPVFYLLGAQKASSTSVGASLAQAGVVWDGPKELGIFCQGEGGGYYQFPGYKRKHRGPSAEWLLHGNAKQNIDSWEHHSYVFGVTNNLRQLPDCGNERGAVADMSPNYMSAQNITEMLLSFYGDSAKDLVFMIVIREPWARMHSAYHFVRHISEYTSQHGQEYHKDFCGFSDMAHEKHEAGNFSDAIENSLYGKAIWRFLEAGFSPSQFVIVPVKSYNDDVNSVVGSVADKLGMSVQNHSSLQPLQANSGRTHPSLSDDQARCQAAGLGSLDGINKLFKYDFLTLATKLCDAQGKGTKLVGYRGQAGDCKEIAQWIRSSWG